MSLAWVWVGMIIATIASLFIAACVIGEPYKGIQYNNDCEPRFQKYHNVKCEVIK